MPIVKLSSSVTRKTLAGSCNKVCVSIKYAMRLRQTETFMPYDTNRNSHAVKASLNIRITKDLPAVRESRVAPLASSRRSVCCSAARKTASEKTLRGEARCVHFSPILSLAGFRAAPQLTEHMTWQRLQLLVILKHERQLTTNVIANV